MPNRIPSIFDRNSASSPFRTLSNMQRQMDRMFDRMWSPAEANLESAMPAISLSWAPACNIDETPSHYLFTLDVPGVKKEDIKIDLRGQILMISGERREDYERKAATQYQSESIYGSFHRSFDLPSEVKADQIEAEYDSGVLRIAIPKKEASKIQSVKIAEGKSGIFSRLLGHKKEEPKTH